MTNIQKIANVNFQIAQNDRISKDMVKLLKANWKNVNYRLIADIQNESAKMRRNLKNKLKTLNKAYQIQDTED